MSEKDGDYMKYICEFFSASDRTDGGIYRMALTDTLDFVRISKIDLPNVQWIELDGDRLCAAYRDKQNGDGYVEFSLDGKRLGDIIRTRGENVCHFCKDGSDVYFANYDDGCVSKSGGKAFIQNGETGPMKARQTTAHAHECIFSPDKRYVLACDLGVDAVIVYDRELNEISRVKVLPGQGVRHAVFSKDGTKLYAITELGSTIARFSWNDGRLTYEKTYDMLQSSGRGDGAEIVLSDDGRHLYATNRANREFGTDNLICHFTVGEELSLVSRVSSVGDHPRHFALICDGKYALSSNTFESSISLFKINDDGELEFIKTEPFPTPMCIKEIL